MRAGALLAMLLMSLLALAAAPPLNIPHAPPGMTAGGGPSALWSGRNAPWFVVHALSDLATGAGTLQRSAYTPGGEWRGTAQWDAAQLLAASSPQERRIYTLHGEPGQAPATMAFEWARFPASLREWLNADGAGEARTAFLRGAREREIGQPQGRFRQRSQILGDIVRSVPLIVGPPFASAEPDRHAFAERYGGRDMAVYVGANDGMLHAFSAASGRELFAYVPRLLHGSLPALSAPDYQMRAWVDGSAAARDVIIGERWRTVLASGLGMGARGLFLLDVSNPAAFGTDGGALWEFGQDDDAGIGHVHAAPVFARLPVVDTAPGWAGRAVVLVASGINPREASAPGSLFMLALDKDTGRPWEMGVNYVRIDTAGASAGGDTANALSPAAVVLDAQGRALHAYAGDLHGNLWHFDLAARRSERVFTARDAGGRAQAIAHAPLVVHAPGGGYLVIFGTGKLLETDDALPAAFGPASLYGIHHLPGGRQAPVRSRAELAERVLSGQDQYAISGEALDDLLPNERRGWYFDLPHGPDEGERAAASPVAAGGVVAFQTIAPSAGKVRRYFINALDGMAVDPLASAKRDKRTGGVVKIDPLQPLIFISGAPEASARDPTGGVVVTRLIKLLTPGPAPEIPVSHQAGRMGWREISNWQDLHEAARRWGG